MVSGIRRRCNKERETASMVVEWMFQYCSDRWVFIVPIGLIIMINFLWTLLFTRHLTFEHFNQSLRSSGIFLCSLKISIDMLKRFYQQSSLECSRDTMLSIQMSYWLILGTNFVETIEYSYTGHKNCHTNQENNVCISETKSH